MFLVYFLRTIIKSFFIKKNKDLYNINNYFRKQ